MDKVFLLSDVDEFYDQLEKIFKGNQTDVQGRWVVSNPCFNDVFRISKQPKITRNIQA